jgi:hypothetical protein
VNYSTSSTANTVLDAWSVSMRPNHLLQPTVAGLPAPAAELKR